MCNFVSLSTAKDVWDTIRVGFFDLSDNSQLYELQIWFGVSNREEIV
jgi:hypothetical protein